MVTVMTVGLLAGCGSSGGSDDSEGGSGDGKTLKVAAFEGETELTSGKRLQQLLKKNMIVQ